MALNALELLHAEYAQLAQRNPATLNRDQRRSLSYYRAELAHDAASAVTEGGFERAAVWILNMFDLERFIDAEGRWPRENNRVPKSGISAAERRLASWVRRQRQAAAAGRLCSYQVARLRCVPGYAAQPIEDRWDAQFRAYQRFIADQRRAPRLRSSDRLERSLAGWAAKQRLQRRAGRLPVQRANALESLTLWAWGNGKF
jgi:hypothetical protein